MVMPSFPTLNVTRTLAVKPCTLQKGHAGSEWDGAVTWTCAWHVS